MNVQAANVVTKGLAAICVLFAALWIIQLMGFGTHYGWITDQDESPHKLDVGKIDRSPFSLPAETKFVDVTARPLFNEDRKPTPADAPIAADAPPAVPLNVSLTGVIITPDVKMAMLLDKGRNQPVALRVGMPLEGDQAAWTLIEVKPRSVTFENADNDRSEIELETTNTPLKAPPGVPQRPASAAAQQPGKPGAGAPRAPMSREGRPDATANDDLARRIEERRRQMREEAEKLRQSGQAGKPEAASPEPAQADTDKN
ncbi:MAG: hypothetical protein ABI451_01255 [Dokdonella sp.]